MIFHSILFKGDCSDSNEKMPEMPLFFGDLNLDQIVDSFTAGREEYDLRPFFYEALNDIDAIEYRHEIFLDLENETLFEGIRTFAQEMRTVRSHLAMLEKLRYPLHKEGWLLETIDIYCNAVSGLVEDLTGVAVSSRGFLAFRKYLRQYALSETYTSLQAGAKKLKASLANIRYCILIKGRTVRVRKFEADIDYSPEVEKTFERFKQGAVKDYRAKFFADPGMDHVGAQILDFVAKLHPDIFSDLNDFCAKNSDFLDETIRRFDREVQFYMAYLGHIAALKRKGLKFCYSRMSKTSKGIHNDEGFDLALAFQLISKGSPVICNDFHLNGKERILVISGPNQGGKTTFARTFGQLHYLAALGCPVPGREASLFLFDKLFTHFEKEEDIRNLRGKLQDDMVRIRHILNEATTNSMIIMNEIFTSTTLKDAILLGRKILERIIRLDLLCVCVSFIEEWASLGDQTVSMVSTVVPENPTLRTYKIVRRPADGISHAISIAEKYRLPYDRLRERIQS